MPANAQARPSCNPIDLPRAVLSVLCSAQPTRHNAEQWFRRASADRYTPPERCQWGGLRDEWDAPRPRPPRLCFRSRAPAVGQNGIVASAHGSEKLRDQPPVVPPEAPPVAGGSERFQKKEMECEEKNRSQHPAVPDATFAEAASSDSHAPKSGLSACSVSLQPCKRFDSPRHMLPRLSHQTLVEKESCEIPAIEFDSHNLHRIPSQHPSEVRPRNPALSAPTPEERHDALPDFHLRYRQPNRSNPRPFFEAVGSWHWPGPRNFVLSSSDHRPYGA